jgi:hypothetical protein
VGACLDLSDGIRLNAAKIAGGHLSRELLSARGVDALAYDREGSVGPDDYGLSL